MVELTKNNVWGEYYVKYNFEPISNPNPNPNHNPQPPLSISP